MSTNNSVSLKTANDRLSIANWWVEQRKANLIESNVLQDTGSIDYTSVKLAESIKLAKYWEEYIAQMTSRK